MAITSQLRRAVVAPKSAGFQLALVVATTAIAGLLRWSLDRGTNGAPFATFFPCVVLAAIFLDWPYAILAALAGGVVGTSFIIRSPLDFPLSIRLTTVTAYLLTASFMIGFGVLLRRTIIELDRQSRRMDLLNIELQHRAGNALQIVKALASRAARSTDPAEFYHTLAGRLDALTKANALLGINGLKSCDLAEFIRRALEPFASGNVEIDGPECEICGELGMSLVLALHELATNATKYGALSGDAGRVRIAWQIEPDGEHVLLRWRESDGPAVSEPTVWGLGSRILRPNRVLHRVDVRYLRDGLECDIGFSAKPA